MRDPLKTRLLRTPLLLPPPLSHLACMIPPSRFIFCLEHRDYRQRTHQNASVNEGEEEGPTATGNCLTLAEKRAMRSCAHAHACRRSEEECDSTGGGRATNQEEDRGSTERATRHVTRQVRRARKVPFWVACPLTPTHAA